MRERGPLTISRPLALAVWAALSCAAALPETAQPVDNPLAPALRAAGEGRLQEAIGILNRLAGEGYRRADLYDLRAQYYLALGRQEDAERDWRRAADLQPLNPGPRLALGRLYQRRGFWPQAVAAYQETLLLGPQNVEAIIGLADCFQRDGRVVAARRLLEAAAEHSEEPRIQDRWAQVAAETGRPADAERALNRIAGRLEGLPKRDVLRRLGAVYSAQGRLEEALAVLREALRIEAGAGGITPETYDLALRPADLIVEQTIGQLTRLVRQLDEGLSSREEAFAGLEAAQRRLAEIGGLVAQTMPPEPRRAAHVNRTYAYSLADEAAVNALTYVDLGVGERRQSFQSTAQEARREVRRLAKL